MKTENFRLDSVQPRPRKTKNTFRYYLKVYGCQYNEWGSTKLDFLLKKFGMEEATEKESDIIFVVACSVRQTAVDRVLGKLKNWQEKKVIITGCVLETDKNKLTKKGAILWDINKPKELLNILPVIHQLNSLSIKELISKESISFSYLPIMKGCNNFCSYCVVPYVRGKEVSRSFDEIVSDFKKLVKNDHKTITLLGQNVNSYKYDFALLLETLNNIPGDFQIYFVSNHPKDMKDDIIFAVRDLAKVAKVIHLPLQSGSNKILKAMNRPYTKEQYLKLVEKIKKEIPNIKITTDAIVGFPGETEEDFQETVKMYEKVGFSQSFTNKYSPRAGTAAFKLGDPISWREKQRRWQILNEIANKKFSKK